MNITRNNDMIELKSNNATRNYDSSHIEEFGYQIESNDLNPINNSLKNQEKLVGNSDSHSLIQHNHQEIIPIAGLLEQETIQNVDNCNLRQTRWEKPNIENCERENLHSTYRSNMEGANNENNDTSSNLLIIFKQIYIQIITTAMCLALIYFNSKFAYSLDQVHFPVFGDIVEQFRHSVIVDMILVGKNDPCQNPYQSTNLGYWPGYTTICECESQSTLRLCSKEEIENGCHQINDLSPISLNVWDEKRICTRRSTKSIIGYYQDSKFVENANGNYLCPAELKKCFISSTQGNFICLNKYELCPITRMAIVPKSEEALDPNRTKWKYVYEFDDKLLLLDNELWSETAFIDIFVQSPACRDLQRSYAMNIDCRNSLDKSIIDKSDEFTVLKNNVEDLNKYIGIKLLNNSFYLYNKPANYLDQCSFNSTINPVIFEKQMNNWSKIRNLLFINPFFLSTLLILNFLRIMLIKFFNINPAGTKAQVRKKELYNVFGRYFVGSFLIITCEIGIILYFILWGYLLLNENRVYVDKWMQLKCLDIHIRSELNLMVEEINRIETYNMIIIGPMIIACILEALFSQYKLIGSDMHEILRE